MKYYSIGGLMVRSELTLPAVEVKQASADIVIKKADFPLALENVIAQDDWWQWSANETLITKNRFPGILISVHP